jgi:hypothetical protein
MSCPAKAGIQYAAAFRFYYRGLGILDRPLSQAMTAHIVAKIIPTLSGRCSPERLEMEAR